ncbi:MAG TPA: CHAT domain-containing protein [Trebonia sp.]|nr:CHAT domain-containing protein [Trebonia sp.]
MPDVLRLEAREFTDATRWRWALHSSDGTLLAEHEVRLDPESWQFEAFTDLHQYMWHAAPDRFAADAERIIAEAGEWIAAEVLGAPVTGALVRARSADPVTVLVAVPPPLLSAPLGLARVDGMPIALQDITFVVVSRTIPPGSPGLPLSGMLPPAPAIPEGDRLRVLGLFSLPEGSHSLNLRRERESLVRLVDGIAAAGKAVDVRVLQYGVTRQRLSDVLTESEGWDVIHLSGHGAPGELLLETSAGKPDRVTGTELAGILGLARARLKLVTVSACWSAAMTAAEQRRLLGLPTPDGDGTPPDDSAPGGLAVELSERLGCAVLAMRYPVADEFAIALAANLYGLLFAEGQALPRAVGRALERLAGDGFPALSMAAPALFGERAAGLALAAPKRATRPSSRAGDENSAGGKKMASFPPPPDRFVGRTGALTRASAALAAESGVAGVLLHGMPGGGKTACALELAYGHEDDFESLAWYRAPDEGMDIASALTDLALALERDVPGVRMVDALGDDAKLAAFASTLTELLRQRRLLLVLDNVESLLSEDGQWRDARWRQVTDALCAHTGRGRVILTSRRRPANTAGLQAAAVDALPADEALLLARELPGLRRLIDGELPGVGRNRSRRLAVGVLSAAHGHPKLLELADGQAADPERLARLVEAGDRAWREQGGPPEGLFTAREQTAPAEDYLHVLAAWTRAVAGTLRPGSRYLFWILCCLEAADREWFVLNANWGPLWTQLGRDGGLPDLNVALASVAARGLAGIRPGADKARETYAVHPGVAAAARAHAGRRFRDTVDTEVAAFWGEGLKYASRADGNGPYTELTVRAGLAAVPYLIRQERWYDAAHMLQRAFNADPTRANAAAMLATITQISRHEPRAAVVRASVLLAIDPAIAETDLRAAVDDSVGRADYRAAAASAARLADLYRMTGRPIEALTQVDQMIRYTGQAGLGPWTQVGDEIRRLQVLNTLGYASEVYAEVYRLHALTRTLPVVAGEDEAVDPWDVRERLMYVGREAALHLEHWDDVLAFGSFLADHLTGRGSSAAEIARVRFTDYTALLRLGRVGEALDLLLSCREAFQDARDIDMLGSTLGALAHVEHERGHGDAAIQLARDALRYEYLGGNVHDIAVTYGSLGNYLHLHARRIESALACHLTASLLHVRSGVDKAGRLATDAAIDLRELGPDAVLPATIPDLCRRLGDIPGTDPAGLLARLFPGPGEGERMLLLLTGKVRERVGMLADAGKPGGEERRKKRFTWRPGRRPGGAR